MHSTLLISTIAATLSVCNGHFTFARIAVNGKWQAPTQFIRNKTEPFDEFVSPGNPENTRYYNYPTYDFDLPNSIRCGRDNMAHAALTEVLEVNAGDELEFVSVGNSLSEWDDPSLAQWEGCEDGRGFCRGSTRIIHPGPLLIHLSKVPDGVSVQEYDGSGDWTKIHTLGLELRPEENPRQPLFWLPLNGGEPHPRLQFVLPKQTPAGQYLLRVDLIYPGVFNKVGDVLYLNQSAQFYPSCAHIQVKSEMSGDLPKGIRIPDEFIRGKPGTQNSVEMNGWAKLDPDYEYPGGLLWNGESLVKEKLPVQ